MDVVGVAAAAAGDADDLGDSVVVVADETAEKAGHPGPVGEFFGGGAAGVHAVLPAVDEDHGERHVRELGVEKRLRRVVVPRDSFHVVEALQRRRGDGTVGALAVVDEHGGRGLVHIFRRDAKNKNGAAGVPCAISYGLRQR